MTTTRIKAENFPDLADPVLYPRLPEYKLAALAAKAERRSFAAGEVLYEQGERDAPFFIIERGRVDLIDHKPGKDMWIAEADAGTFVGDIATFTGEPAMAECVASEPTETIVFDRPAFAPCWPARRRWASWCSAACWHAAPGTRAPATACCGSSRSAAHAAPSRSAISWSATWCRCASTTSTSTRTPTRSSTGWTSRARRRRF